MSDITIYHNARCSNSRGALELLRERGIEPTIVDYIKEPLGVAELTALAARLGVPVRELLRSKEAIYQELNLAQRVMRDLVNNGAVELVAATVEHGASSEQARAWWGNFLVQKANEIGAAVSDLPITPAQVAAVVKLVDDGKLSTKLARQVVEGVLAGEV